MPPPTSVELSDHDVRTIVRAIRGGSAEAFGEFYDRYFDACVALTRRITKQDEDFCLDVVQDVMLVVADRLPRLRTSRAFASWLRKSLYTTAIDHLRKAERSAAREQAASRPEISEQRGPAERAIASEQVEWLEDALRGLAEDERTLVLARFGESTTIQGAGARVGLGGDAAHGRIRRILARLRIAGRSHMEHEV